MGISSSLFITSLAVVMDGGWGYILIMSSRLFWIHRVGKVQSAQFEMARHARDSYDSGNVERQL